jgi:hypothetical protein
MSIVERVVDRQETLRQWTDAVDQLLAQVSAWGESENWDMHTEEKELREKAVGSYRTRTLALQTPAGRLILEPVAQSVPGAEGRVDLYAWPTLNRVRLLRTGDHWTVRTDSGIDWPHPWNRDTFVELARALTNAP